MKQAFLGLGSNLGDREENLRVALRFLMQQGIRIDQVSPIYETEPEGLTDQGWFLNAVAEVRTELSPRDLLACSKNVEQTMKRQKTVVNGPRIIDIDILFYQSAILNSPTLQIPHPRLRERRFVLAPLADIAPFWRDPVTQRTVTDLLAATRSGRFRRLG